MKTIVARIKDSFPEDNRDEVKQYLDWLRGTIIDYSTNLRRAITLLIIAAAAFEFVIQSPRSTFQLAGFQISRDSIVLQFVPALIAYFYLQTLVDSIYLSRLRDAFISAFECWCPKAGENYLYNFLQPSLPIYWGLGWSSEDEQSPEEKARVRTAAIFVVAILVATLAFEAQAYYTLFTEGSISHHIFWALSLCVTLFCLISAVVFMVSDA